MTIELSSHTDSRGERQYNQSLSQQRAEAAVNYLVSKGIARKRLVAKGYGENRLVNNCADGVNCTEEEHEQNRRTEIKVLKY
ncbi:Photosystem I chlorophyll a apoprotein A2 [compost metagenome]